MFNKTTDLNRILVLLICDKIYENKPKLNLLSTCKFAFSLRYSIVYYKKITMGHYTISQFKSPTDFKNLNNITNLRITYDTREFLGRAWPRPINKINYYGDKLKKLTADLQIIKHSNCSSLPKSLTYLKLYIGTDGSFIFDNLPQGLKCLILEFDYGVFDKCNEITILSSTIEHVGLYTSDFEFPSVVKKIIPTNIKYFEFNDIIFFEKLHKYSLLTKIKFCNGQNDEYFANNIKKIPDNITSINYYVNKDSRYDQESAKLRDVGYLAKHKFKCNKNCNCYDHCIEHVLSNLKQTVTTLSLHHYRENMEKKIPVTVVKLKLYEFIVDMIIPDTIQELCVKNIKSKLFVGSNVKKLTIKYRDRNMLDPDINAKIVYTY